MLDDLSQTFLVIGNIAILAMVVPLTIFIVLYKERSPWRETELGIALMFQKIALAVMVAVIIAGNFLPPDWDLFRRGVRAVLFFGVLFFLTVDVFNLHEYQKKGPRRRLFFKWLTLSAEDKRRRARDQAQRDKLRQPR